MICPASMHEDAYNIIEQNKMNQETEQEKKKQIERAMDSFNIESFEKDFKEGIYCNGEKIIECWWSYENKSICLNDRDGLHTSVYPIVFHSFFTDYKFIGEV